MVFFNTPAERRRPATSCSLKSNRSTRSCGASSEVVRVGLNPPARSAIMTAMDKIAALKRTAMFGELNDMDLRALADRASERRLGRGEILFFEGDEGGGLYVIVEGSVRAFRESLEGREQVIHVETAGATIAEVPVFDDGLYPSTVAGEEDSLLLFINKRDVRRLCLDHPQIALAALNVLATRVRRTAALVEQLSLFEVDQRLARLLLAEARA